ncbi:MAG TPA: outer membrane beta-barrel protein [Panacibacter sp.]|nr:outer membrane beta-barrel protein [Panacibacter sp.]
MKKITGSVFILAIFSAIAFNANAQKGKVNLNLDYSYSLPLGSFKNNIISNASPRGLNGALMYGISNKLSVGLQSGYQDYYQKYPRDVYTTGDHEVTSAVLSNSLQTIPLIAKAMYTPLADNKAFIQPYISLGTGISLTDYRQYLGEFGSVSSTANFTVQGGAGIKVAFKKNSTSGFNIGAGYNYIAYRKFGYSNLDNLSFQAGVHFPLK